MIQAFTILLRAVYVFCFHVWPLKNVSVYNAIYRAEALKHDRYNIDWCRGNKRAYGAMVADCLISINVCTQIIIFNAFPVWYSNSKTYTHIPFFFCCRCGVLGLLLLLYYFYFSAPHYYACLFALRTHLSNGVPIFVGNESSFSSGRSLYQSSCPFTTLWGLTFM